MVGTVVQRAHYFGVSKTLQPITDPAQFKGLKIVTSPEPNTNYSVAKRLLEKAGLKVGVDATIVPVNPGTEIAAMLAGQADIAIAYQPSVAAAEAQGAKVVFDFSSYIGPFCNTGIMVLPTTIQKDPEMVQALVTSFEEASRKTYADPAFSKEVARKEFPDLPGEVVDKAIDPSGAKVWHAALRIGDSMLFVNDVFPEMGGEHSRSDDQHRDGGGPRAPRDCDGLVHVAPPLDRRRPMTCAPR